MTNNNQIWVSPMEGGWRVHKPGSSNDIIHTKTKAEAEMLAKKIGKNQGLETKIQRKDGIIQGGNSYGKDPCPPKGENMTSKDYFKRRVSTQEAKDVFKRLSEK